MEKAVGILRLDNGEDVRDIAALCVDSNGYIWTGNFHQGKLVLLNRTFTKMTMIKFSYHSCHCHDELLSLIGRHRTETNESSLTSEKNIFQTKDYSTL